MTIERVLEVLEIIGGYSDDEIARYTPIARKNLDLLESKNTTLDAIEEQKLAYLIGAKTNLEIALINSQNDGVKSFAAGDVKIEQTDSVSIARVIYDSALEDAAGIIDDSAFCFRSV